MNETDLLHTAVKMFYLTRPSFLHVDLILIDATNIDFILLSRVLVPLLSADLPSGWLSDRALIVWTDSFEGGGRGGRVSRGLKTPRRE